jgi:hypothetical protein
MSDRITVHHDMGKPLAPCACGQAGPAVQLCCPALSQSAQQLTSRCCYQRKAFKSLRTGARASPLVHTGSVC